MRHKKYKTKRNKRIKRSKTIKRKLKRNSRTKSGGNLELDLDLRQIFITNAIIATIKKYNPDFDYRSSGFRQGPNAASEAPFPLGRMDRIMELNPLEFNNLLITEPIEVKPTRLGVLVNGKQLRAYELVNGRHRFTRAILEGRPTINAINYQP